MSGVCPTVDVVMIAYNKEAYIDEAIKGVMKQRGNFRLQLIIMDDCSTDRTPEIVEQWRSRFPDVICVYRNQSNLGLQRNYIEGFSHCTGRYLAICDADDYWFSSRKLDRQIRYMESHPECAITFHRVVNFYEDSGEMSLSNGRQRIDTTIADLSRSNYITNLSVMYRRGYVDLGNLPAWLLEDRAPDYAFHMLYAAHGTIHYFKRPMGVYRKVASGNWSMTGQFERQKMALIVRLNLIDQLSYCHGALPGLRKSASDILSIMSAMADTDDRRRFVDESAIRLGLKVEPRPLPSKCGRPLLSKIRGAISRLVPRPRP